MKGQYPNNTENKIGHYQYFQRQKGAGMIFFAFFIPIMMIMIVLIGDIGQIVYEKVRLQQTVDQAALSAANVQAIGLNEIADLNSAAYDEYQQLSSIMRHHTWYDHSMARRVTRYFDEVFSWLDIYREDANIRFAELAHDYADAIVRNNLPEAVGAGMISIEPVAGASNQVLMQYVTEIPSVRYKYYLTGCKKCSPKIVSRWNSPGSTNKAYNRPPGATQFLSKRRIKMSGVYRPSVRWQKITPPVTYAAYKLTQKEKRFLLGNRIFTDIYPELTVYASAKPTQGDIFNMSPSYVPTLKQLQGHMPLPAVENLPRVLH